MTKTNTRVRRNSLKKTACPQVATSPEVAPGKTPTLPSDIAKSKRVQLQCVSDEVAKNYRGPLTILVAGQAGELLGSFCPGPYASARLLFAAAHFNDGCVANAIECHLAESLTGHLGLVNFQGFKGDVVSDLFKTVRENYSAQVLNDLKSVTERQGALSADQMWSLSVSRLGEGYQLARAADAERFFGINA